MSTFDPEQFMNVTIEGSNDTKRPVVPAGEYRCQVFKLNPRSGTIEKGERAGKHWCSYNVVLEVLDEAVKQELEQERVFVNYNVFLDLDDNNQLDMGRGKNVALGKLREAVNQNDPSSPWSFAMLLGQTLKANVTVGVNPKTGDEMNNVTAVAPDDM